MDEDPLKKCMDEVFAQKKCLEEVEVVAVDSCI
jgi:hypothetical protein